MDLSRRIARAHGGDTRVAMRDPLCDMDIEANRSAKKWSRKELIARILWTACLPLFRFSPQPCWGWRRFLLRLFRAKVGREVQIHPSTRIFMP